MKVVYLDQNHWIELSRAVYGLGSQPETPKVLDALREAQVSGRASFPLSLAHYMETLKHQTTDRRARLGTFMRELSGGMTVAPPEVVVRHEIEQALGNYFPGRIAPLPFQFLGFGLSHALAKDLGFHLEWPPGADKIPAFERAVFERRILALVEDSLLSGVLLMEQEPPMDLTLAKRFKALLAALPLDQQFKASLAEWRGAASRYPPEELDRRIYAITLSDIWSAVQEILLRHKIAIQEFALLGEVGWRAFLDAMPSRRADMHLRRQWAKNADLPPRDSDLNDWAYLGVAVCYCDIVVTEKQAANLFSRALNTPATIVA